MDEIHPNNALIIDGMVVIQTVKGLPQTFGELVERIIQQIIMTAKNLIVWNLSSINTWIPCFLVTFSVTKVVVIEFEY